MDKLIKYLPIISGILIYLGYLKLHFYYNYFGISIINYLSLTEIITSFLDDLNIIIICTGLMILHMFLGSSIITRIINLKRKNKISVDAMTRVYSKPKDIWSFILAIIITIGTGYYYFKLYNIVVLYLLFLFVFQLTFRTYEILGKWGFEIDNWIKSVVLIAIFSLLPYCLAAKEIYDLGNSNYSKVKIVTKNKVIEIRGKNKLLGKTFDFYFLKINNEIHVYPKSEVLSIKYCIK